MNWQTDFYKANFSEGKNITSIKGIVKKHKALILVLLSMHVLPGCDSVPAMFGIGKKSS